MTEAEVEIVAEQFDMEAYGSIIESLIYDGYIHFDESQQVYRFNSYILQRWWSKKKK
ncbi:MAG: hypothetical protein AAGI23_01840 [Bacteroidota bacterium]